MTELLGSSTALLVAGGGIGGLACALALALARGATGAAADRGPEAVHRPIHAPRPRIDLLEQADAFGEVGAGLQLGPNATRRLHALGLKEVQMLDGGGQPAARRARRAARPALPAGPLSSPASMRMMLTPVL